MNRTPHPFPELCSLLEALPEPHAVLDQHYRILFANTAYRGQSKGEGSILGRRCYEISHHYTAPCDQFGESCPLMRSCASGVREQVLHLHHTPNGQEYVSIELIPIRNGDGEMICFVEKFDLLQAARSLSGNEGLVGCSASFQKMMGLVARVSKSEATVLLEGESGTGKELVANALHCASARANAPFIVVDCSGIPETLFESELFGHERGAFTGANSRKEGLVEAASGGTLFLDEVGDIPLSMQVKLLRLLETGTYRRVGATEIRHADLRIVSATHRNLRKMVDAGSFRADLFYRLNTFPIVIPSLRDRGDDIPLLVDVLLRRVAPERQITLSGAAMQRLRQYRFPGNVRELRNLLERASLLCDHDVIEAGHLQLEAAGDEACVAWSGATGETEPDAAQFGALLAAHKGSRRSLARKLGMSERTLYRRLREHAEGKL